MLRIGLKPQAPQGQGPAGPPPQGAPAGPPPALVQALMGGGGDDDGDEGGPQSDGPQSSRYDAEKVDPTIAGYMGPEKGPFMCGRCGFFDGQGACHLVKGRVDPHGCCNMFTPQAAQPQGAPDEAGLDSTPASPSDEGGGTL